MCGVIGLICQKQRQDLGQIAADLLKTLEYRGYDSTGAAIQGAGSEVRPARRWSVRRGAAGCGPRTRRCVRPSRPSWTRRSAPRSRPAAT